MNEKGECDKYFVLGVLLVLGIGLCALAFFCGEEIMRKLLQEVNLIIYIYIGALLILLGMLIIRCFSIANDDLKSLENQYYVLTEENKNERETLLKQKNILVYSDVLFIYSRQFSGFYNLEKIEFFGEIKICDTAFFGCTNLKEIVFYADVSSLGKFAFAGCKSLEKIIFYGNIPEIVDETVFKGIENKISIYVTANKLEDANKKFDSEKFEIKTNVLQTTDTEYKNQRNVNSSTNKNTSHNENKKIAPAGKDIAGDENNNLPQKSAKIENN